MPSERSIIDLGDEFGKVILDPANYEFNPDTLSTYLEKEAGWYDYYGQKLADADYLAALAEEAHDLKFAAIYRVEKGEGATEKLAESRAKTDPEVAKLKMALIEAKHRAAILKQHLKSWDKAHENAQNRGNTLRKEMDRISGTIYAPPGSETTPDSWQSRQADNIAQRRAEAQIDDIVGSADKAHLENLPQS